MVSSVALQAGELLAAALLAGTVLVAVVVAPYLTTPTGYRQRPGAVGPDRPSRPRRSDGGNKARSGWRRPPSGPASAEVSHRDAGTAVPVTEHGVMIAAPGHRPQVAPAHQPEQVLAQAAPAMGSARPGRGERRWQL
jgi:hypothetical protein